MFVYSSLFWLTSPIKVENGAIYCMGQMDDQVVLAESEMNDEDEYEANKSLLGTYDEKFACPLLRLRLELGPGPWLVEQGIEEVERGLELKVQKLSRKKLVCGAVMGARAIIMKNVMAQSCELPERTVDLAFYCDQTTKSKPLKGPVATKPENILAFPSEGAATGVAPK